MRLFWCLIVGMAWITCVNADSSTTRSSLTPVDVTGRTATSPPSTVDLVKKTPRQTTPHPRPTAPTRAVDITATPRTPVPAAPRPAPSSAPTSSQAMDATGAPIPSASVAVPSTSRTPSTSPPKPSSTTTAAETTTATANTNLNSVITTTNSGEIESSSTTPVQVTPETVSHTPSLVTPSNDMPIIINQAVPVVPLLSRVNSNCIKRGEFIIFAGENLTLLRNKNLTIKQKKHYSTLTTITLTNTQLVARADANLSLTPNHAYPVYIHTPPNQYKKTAISIRLCSDITEANNANQDQRDLGELLILSSAAELISLKQYLRQHHLVIAKEVILSSLDKTLLTIEVAESTIMTSYHDLQQRFPKVTIDFNSHYMPTAKPRLYATKKVTWPQPVCTLKTALKIGIIDGQIDKSHPALSSQTIAIKSFLDASEQAESQHGSSIAVILSGDQPSHGYQGLLKGARLFNASVLRQKNNQLTANTESIVEAINWLIEQNVRLTNLSLSSPNSNKILDSVLSTATNHGLIIFSAAGNNGKDAPPSYPAALDNVFAITAIDAANRIYTEANQGSYIDFAAPGVDIWLIKDRKQGQYSSGTSFATPYAVAIAALFLNQNTSLSASILYKAMKSNIVDLGTTGKDDTYGWGLLQAGKSLCRM